MQCVSLEWLQKNISVGQTHIEIEVLFFFLNIEGTKIHMIKF